MTLRNLSTETMLSHSAEWLDPSKPSHPVLIANDATRGLVKQLETAHNGLLTTFRPAETTGARLTAIQDQEETADGIHDRKARGGHGLLTALAELTDHPETREKLLATRDRLFADGLDITRWSYSDEAGNALVLAERLDPATRADLATLVIRVGDEDLSVIGQLDAQIQAGKRLGELEQEKASLTGQPAIPLARRSAARNEWMRIVDLMERNISNSHEMTADARALLLDRLHNEQAKADRRVADQRKKNAKPKASSPAKTEPPKG